MTPEARAWREIHAQEFRRAAAWLYELDEVIVRTVYERILRQIYVPQLWHELHEQIGKTALRQVRIQAHQVLVKYPQLRSTP